MIAFTTQACEKYGEWNEQVVQDQVAKFQMTSDQARAMEEIAYGVQPMTNTETVTNSDQSAKALDIYILSQF